MLGTNPAAPDVMDKHILERQRKLILGNSKINKAVNKYLDAIPPSEDRGAKEVELIIENLEKIVGRTFSVAERETILSTSLDELKETFAELDTKGLTVFFKDKASGRPMIGDHMIYGFMKAAAEAIGRTLPKKQGTILHSVSYTQSIINQHVRAEEEFIVFDKDIVRKEDGSPAYEQRSLRAMTAQGPRITLASSEVVPAGARLSFVLRVMENSPLTEESIRRMMGYGEIVGLGQWRSSGRGSFKVVTLEEI